MEAQQNGEKSYLDSHNPVIDWVTDNTAGGIP